MAMAEIQRVLRQLVDEEAGMQLSCLERYRDGFDLGVKVVGEKEMKGLVYNLGSYGNEYQLLKGKEYYTCLP